MNFFLKTFPPLLASSLLKTVYFKLNLEVITQDSDQLVLVLKPVKSFFQHCKKQLSFAFPNMKAKQVFSAFLGTKYKSVAADQV